ncbi:Transcription elongation factor 1 [Monoraphidium neglectum]|uniref:Transcription elongation factor 1 homolog n=1 Tax=Monoraphidium neglectum TaxID=145388 RepID=A0A0D2KVK8_9CHLO|nr:Transcription elongation factor 1 [Monoraphidium neglectum]KIY99418.1 Transcription elongation factor 1 [Monoraphidium neglectum]|eukprot:XP_013898438.1 Transcription elongation factor 1 [Monoraphidium neglectum]
MGKRKSSAKPPPKAPAPKLDTSFNCPFCNSTKTVQCTMDWERQEGTVECVHCKESFSSKINHLSEPIDIYSDWLDACESANA